MWFIIIPLALVKIHLTFCEIDTLLFHMKAIQSLHKNIKNVKIYILIFFPTFDLILTRLLPQCQSNVASSSHQLNSFFTLIKCLFHFTKITCQFHYDQPIAANKKKGFLLHSNY